MPKIEWRDLPPELRQVPEGPWYKDFGSFKLFGRHDGSDTGKVVSAVGMEPTTYRLRVAETGLLRVSRSCSRLREMSVFIGLQGFRACSTLLTEYRHIELESL